MKKLRRALLVATDFFSDCGRAIQCCHRFGVLNSNTAGDYNINTLKKENKELKQALTRANNDNKKLEARLNALESKIK